MDQVADSPPRPEALPGRRRGGCLRTLLKLAISLLLFFGVAEGVLRAMGYGDGPARYYDPEIGLRFFPHQDRVQMGPDGAPLADIRTNELGYRGPWYPGPKPEGTRRVFCLGDSFTFGWGVQGKDAWPQKLRELLDGEEGSETQVYNLGVPGYNTRNELQTYREHARPLQPDVVVLSYFLNDLQPDGGGPRYTQNAVFHLFAWSAMLDAFHRHLRGKIPLFDAQRSPELVEAMAFYEANFLRIQDEPAWEGARPYWEESMGALAELAAEVEADGARLLVVIFPAKRQLREARRIIKEEGVLALQGEGLFALQDEVRRRSEELGLPVLDLMTEFATSKVNPFGTVDTGHPSPHGYQFSAAAIRDRLKELGLL